MVVVVHGRADKESFKVQIIVIMVIIMRSRFASSFDLPPASPNWCMASGMLISSAYLASTKTHHRHLETTLREKSEKLRSRHRVPLSLNIFVVNNPTTNWPSPTSASSLLFLS